MELRNRTFGSAIRALETELDGEVEVSWFVEGITPMSIHEDGVLVRSMHKSKVLFRWCPDFLSNKTWAEDHANGLIECDFEG